MFKDLESKQKIEFFIKKYCTAIEKDDKNNGFVRLPIDNYVDLSITKYYLIRAIEYAMDAHNYDIQDEELTHTVQILTKILKALDLGSEVEGIQELINNQKQIKK